MGASSNDISFHLSTELVFKGTGGLGSVFIRVNSRLEQEDEMQMGRADPHMIVRSVLSYYCNTEDTNG